MDEEMDKDKLQQIVAALAEGSETVAMLRNIPQTILCQWVNKLQGLRYTLDHNNEIQTWECSYVWISDQSQIPGEGTGTIHSKAKYVLDCLPVNQNKEKDSFGPNELFSCFVYNDDFIVLSKLLQEEIKKQERQGVIKKYQQELLDRLFDE